MATYSTNEFKQGLKVMMDNAPYSIIENEFVKPGKGQAFNRVKMRNLLTDRVIERTFKSGDVLESADVNVIEMQYLYADGVQWHFMVPDTFEQYVMDEAVMVNAKQWIKEQDICMVTLFNNAPLVVEPPIFVMLKIVETDPGIKGDTATGGTKPARVETGATVRVPLFVQEGEILKIDTRTGEYISRSKE